MRLFPTVLAYLYTAQQNKHIQVPRSYHIIIVLLIQTFFRDTRRWDDLDCVFCPWSGVGTVRTSQKIRGQTGEGDLLPGAGPPPAQCKDGYKRSHADRIVPT